MRAVAPGEKSMTESSLPAAGWYPAAHADGQPRYWDGSAWTDGDPATMPVAVQHDPGAVEGEAERAFLRRPMMRRTGLIATASALVVGLLLGGGLGGSTAQSEVAALEDQVAALEVDLADAEDVASANDAALADARADLDDALADLATASEALTTATTQMTEMETVATASQTELDARAARIADLEGQLSVRAAPAPAPAAPAPAAPAPAAPASAWYDNCTAVRNAGAAPIRVGDPGYAKHLDRDGDGIGCE